MRVYNEGVYPAVNVAGAAGPAGPAGAATPPPHTHTHFM